MSSDDERYKLPIEYKLNSCRQKNVLEPEQIFIENIKDVASALVKILKIFGIFQYKLQQEAQDVIMDALIHYDDVFHRIETMPKKRIRKANLIHGLGSKCSMTLSEAQLTYSVVKRAFKAYYYGTDKFGNEKDPSLDAQQIHTRECLWVHAAKRTALVFAEYDGMFFSTQKKYEELLKRVYMTLNNRINNRSKGLGKEAPPNKPPNEPTSEPTSEPPNEPSKDNTEVKEDTLSQELNEIIRNPCYCTIIDDEQNVPPNVMNCQRCDCPPLTVDFDIDLSGIIKNAECSQGPFTCRWLAIGPDEDVWDPCVPRRSDDEVCAEKLSEPSTEMSLEDKVGEEFSGIIDDEDVESYDQPMDGDSYVCKPAKPNLNPIMLKDKKVIKKKYQWEEHEIPLTKPGPVSECSCIEIQSKFCAKIDENGEIISRYDISEGVISKFTYACEGHWEDRATDLKSRIESKSSVVTGHNIHQSTPES